MMTCSSAGDLGIVIDGVRPSGPFIGRARVKGDCSEVNGFVAWDGGSRLTHQFCLHDEFVAGRCTWGDRQ